MNAFHRHNLEHLLTVAFTKKTKFGIFTKILLFWPKVLKIHIIA